MMKSPFFWFTLVGLIVSVDLVAFGYLIARSSTDQTFSVEDNYYEKGLDWDARMAQDRVNAELGWTVRLHAGLGDENTRELTVTVLDQEGSALTGATVRVELFANLRASERFSLGGFTDERGVWRVEIPSETSGYWEARLRIRDASERVFTHTELFMVADQEWGTR